jgi:hypothetical protein
MSSKKKLIIYVMKRNNFVMIFLSVFILFNSIACASIVKKTKAAHYDSSSRKNPKDTLEILRNHSKTRDEIKKNSQPFSDSTPKTSW